MRAGRAGLLIVLAGVAVAAALAAGVRWAGRVPAGDRATDAPTRVSPSARDALASLDAGDPTGLRIDVLDVGRPARDIVEIRLALTNRDAARRIDIRDRFAGAPSEEGTLSGAVLTVAGGARRYYVLRDDRGRPACSHDLGSLAPGERREAFVRFGSPSRDASTIGLQLKGLPAIEGLDLAAAP
jgi:hypothetical protein